MGTERPVHHGGYIDPVALHEWAKRGGSALATDKPVRRKGRQYSAADECRRCGEGPMTRHHIAPKYIFGEESFAFGTVRLCGDCQKKWHTALENYIALRVMVGAVRPEMLIDPSQRVPSQRKVDLIRAKAVRRVQARFFRKPHAPVPPPVRTLVYGGTAT